MKNALTQIKIKNAGPGNLEDGGGLRLVKNQDRGKWVYRYSHLGKRREMGLGPWPAVSLAAARQARDAWAAELSAGRDPIDVRRQHQEAAVAARERRDPTFSEMVDIVFDARRATLRGDGTRGRWRSPLDLYALPAFGRKRASQLTQRDVLDALKPIWHKKHPTATKAIQRIAIVLKSAKRMGFPADPDIVDSAREMLGVARHIVTPTAAVAWQDVPALYAKLGDTTAGLCNRWIMLTLVRMDAARKAQLVEIDGDVWTVPEDRIKGTEGSVKDFRVPLTAAAIEIADSARRFGREYLFPGKSGPLTDAAVEKCLRVAGAAGTPHGFRSSFRTWAEDTGQPWDVAETVLGHQFKGKVERAYARSDLLDRRRIVMEKWAAHVTATSAEVIKLRRS